MATHIHLDLVGGLSGDMFIGAMLDVFPQFWPELPDVIAAAGFPDLVELTFEPHNDGVLSGSQFDVSEVQSCDEHEHHHRHDHRHYSEIKKILSTSGLEPAVARSALAMFQAIAEVEAKIHGKSVDEVAFHEVGAWDSIADIVLSAFLVHQSQANSFSVSAVPMGRGFVQTAHGRLPVPAPATARLLEGFAVVDDGIEGERVTPTGAAILKHLAPLTSLPGGLLLKQTGYGFGKKTFEGLSNTVRVTLFETAGFETAGTKTEGLNPASASRQWHEEEVIKLAFELDDQTPESIAEAMTTIRNTTGVLDVIQQPYWGKKGRQGISVTVLTAMASSQDVTRLCFEQTTTLGIRREQVSRAILAREEVDVLVNGQSLRVKVARRPSGLTAKVEMDDLAAIGLGYSEQMDVRRQAEQLAIHQVEGKP